MTTNQTIDGVPRELLDRMIALDPGCNMDGVTLYEDCTQELRALLDAPAVKVDYGSLDAEQRLAFCRGESVK